MTENTLSEEDVKRLGELEQQSAGTDTRERGERWDPKMPGEALKGKIVTKREVVGYTKAGKRVPNKLMEIRAPDGKLWTVWETEVLKSSGIFKEPVGSLVYIKYLGDVPSKHPGHNPYKNFQTAVASGG